MSKNTREYSPLDIFLTGVDQALRLASGKAPSAHRDNPGDVVPDLELAEQERIHAAGLMRINHTGEICAQALYAGQAATARNPDVRRKMEQAANEEVDHLSWCEQRLSELDARPSVLNGLWYLGSWTIGAGAGLAGDEWSLGFLMETERQVEAHLDDHLGQLPEGDKRSQAILQQMKTDEAQHALIAENAGARPLPQPIQAAMRFSSEIMKAVAYRL